MKGRTQAVWLLIVMVFVGCGAPQSPTSSPPIISESRSTTTPKRITAAVLGDAHTLYNKLNIGNGVPGIEAIEELVNAGLANFDQRGNLRAQLGEAVPTTDNGLWKLLADGRMEVSWRIRDGAQWQDGAPFTTQDLLFTAQVMRDRDLPPFRDANYALLEGVEAPDDRTVVARWKQAFIYADSLFTRRMTLPLPRHLLEQPYAENKPGFLELPYWSHEFVGTGPFKLRELVRGSHLVLDADDRYVLGRPKIDAIEVRFFLDPGILMANLLAGEVQLTLHRTLSLEAGIEVRDQWRDGRMEVAPASLYRLWPQLSNPMPEVIGDVRFRRALLHAIDRQQLVDTLQGGVSAVAQTFLPPNRPEYAEIEAGAMRYEYDPRKAAQMIEGLGYARGADGTFRGAEDQQLSVEIRSSGGGTLEPPVILSIADYWQRAGVRVETVFVPPQRNQDREYRATRPGFVMRGGTSDLRGLDLYHSAAIPRPETNFVGLNDSHYASPEYDALLDRYRATIPKAERMRIVARLVSHISEHLPILPLFYNMQPTMIANRLINVGSTQSEATQAWNAATWDMRERNEP